MTPLDVEAVAFDALTVLGSAGAGFLIGAAASILLSVIMRMVLRRNTRLSFLSQRLKVPQRVMLMLLGTGIGVMLATAPGPRTPEPGWRPYFEQAFLIAIILAAAFVVTGVIQAVEDGVVKRAEGDEETPHFRRIRTQMQIVSRVLIAIVWICAVAGAMLTFDQFRAIGASLFASAGVLSIVAGLAAQSSLANVFAGMQIAFSDAIRVGDIVVIEGANMGSVEEITLTYVVVRTWDNRRWVVPSNYFTTKSFENWTRQSQELLGTVELDLDWLIPVEAMRIETARIVHASDLWDGRSVNLQVTDATGGTVRVRAVVSANSSGNLWDLRCYLREELIKWLQEQAVYALPRHRLEPETTTAPPPDEREEFIAQVVDEWRAEQAAQKTQVLPSVIDTPTPPDVKPLAPRRSWLQALRDQRAAAAQTKAPPPPPEATTETTLWPEKAAALDETRMLPPATVATPEQPADDSEPSGKGSSKSPEARLYSGSPEADERNRSMSGPSAADMAERARAAERRKGSPPNA